MKKLHKKIISFMICLLSCLLITACSNTQTLPSGYAECIVLCEDGGAKLHYSGNCYFEYINTDIVKITYPNGRVYYTSSSNIALIAIGSGNLNK